MPEWNFCPRAIIFDMDGLLIDSEPIWEDIEIAMLSARGATLTDEVRARFIGRRLNDFWSGLHQAYDLPGAVEDLMEESVVAMVARIGREAPLRPGAEALLAHIRARQLPTAIASSSPMRIIDAVVGAHAWSALFATRVSGDDVPEGKPAPDIYLEAARRLGVAPAECLALEDSITGSRAAVAAGMVTIAVPDLSHVAPDAFAAITPYVFTSLHEVLAAIEECP